MTLYFDIFHLKLNKNKKGANLRRDTNNPLIHPENIPTIPPDIIDATSVFNPGAIKFNDKTLLMLRVQNRARETYFIMAESEDETKIFNPNTTTETFGIAKVFIKDDTQELSTRFGAAFKQHFNSNIDGSTNDGGLEFVGIYTKPFKDNVIKYFTNLNLYKPFFYSESDVLEGTDFEDAWKQVRMNWQHDVDISLTSLINLKLYVQLLYNEMDVDFNGESIDEIQFKETLGLGLSYKLF